MRDQEENISLPFFGVPKILPYLRPYRRMLILMILMGAATSAIDAVYPLFNRYALDHFVGEGTMRGVIPFIGLYLLVLFGQTALAYKSTIDCGRAEMYTNRDLRNAAFNHLQTLSFSYFNQNSVGYIHSRVMSDTGLIGDLVSWRTMNFVWSGAYILFVLVVMFLTEWRLALLVSALIPAAAVLMAYFQKKLVFYNRKIREVNAKITGNYNEGITGARTVKALAVEERMEADFRRDTGEMHRTAVREAHFSALFISTVTMLSAFALAIVLQRGGRLTREGLMRIGTLSVFMSYALELLDPIHNIIETLSAFVAIQVNIERLTRLLNEEPDVADPPAVREKYGDTFRPKKENWEKIRGDISFDHVSFRYPDGEEYVLTDFCLDVPAGTNVAIVGETGAGKSTLVNLVCRFFEPTKGRILIDGRDARERSVLWLHSSIGYVLQTPHLFSGSIRENLRYGKPDATDEEIMDALRLVAAEDIPVRMGKGLDSDVGEGGDLLSTGEKQLLSFARAILADPRILVLDEATSSVDTVTEKMIQNAIRTVIRGRTSFVIAHRLSTITDADVILVVKDGKIAEKGTHRELLRHRGYYSELYTRQYEEMVWENA